MDIKESPIQKRSVADQNEIAKKIQSVIEKINDSIVIAATKDIEAQKKLYNEVGKELSKTEERRRESLEKNIATLRIKHILQNEEEENKYRLLLLQKETIERAKSKKELANLEKEVLEEKLEFEKSQDKRVLDRNKKEQKALEKKLKTAQKINSDIKAERKEGLKEERKDILKDELKNSFKAFTEAIDDPNKHIAETLSRDLSKSLEGLGRKFEESLNQINQSISRYAEYQTAINTRLQGISDFGKTTNALKNVAFSPLINAETLYTNLNTLVGEGIAFDLEQRALLMTIKDSIATTFDANSDSLKRMIRIQQSDSTAARLGMESYLTKWLNEYVKNTEYLTNTFDSVASSLFEASALLKEYGNGMSEEFEYIVQKWLGTLTGVGMSNDTAQQLASAIGALGSGDISGLGSGIYNLLTMAASRQGLSLGSILNTGLDANDVNDLLYGVTSYMQELNANNSNVVKNQLSKIFGVSVTDLLAASNLKSEELTNVYNNMMTTSNMYSELQSQMNTITQRMGISNILQNMFSNFTFQTGMDIAANPLTYAMWKITDLIQGVTGGINIPFVSALGSGVDLNTTVENLMKIGIVGASTLGNIGKLASGLSSLKDGSILLEALNVSSGNTALTRGSGISQYVGEGLERKKASTVSKSTSTYVSAKRYVGEENSSAYENASLAQASDKVKEANPDVDSSENDLKHILYERENNIGGSLLSILDLLEAGFKEGLNIKNWPSQLTENENGTTLGNINTSVQTIDKKIPDGLDKLKYSVDNYFNYLSGAQNTSSFYGNNPRP